MDIPRALQPATALWNRYHPDAAPYAFTADSADEAVTWQHTVRVRLSDVLGLSMLEHVDPEPEMVECVDKGDYYRQRWMLWTTPHTVMPVYLLLPKGVTRPPAVLAFHGHGYGVRDIVGLWEDGTERDTPDGYHKDFGVALCRSGFAVAAPEISCFGDRQTDFSYLNPRIGQGAPSTCTHTAMLAFHLGLTPLAFRVHDAVSLLDWLQTVPEIDASRAGAMGISGGGMNCFFFTCLEPRIRAAVVSGYFCTFRDSVLAMSHCACNFVPGLAAFGEMYDLAGLIAPRPLLVESGSRDGIFPRPAVEEALSHAGRIYRLFSAEEHLRADYFEGRHQISGRVAYDFLRVHLGN